MLVGIASFCEMNVPGLQVVEYVPTAWIDRSAYRKVANSVNNWQYAISFSEGGWLALPLVPFGRLWQEDEGSNAQGPVYTQNINGRTPKLRPAVTGELARMSRYRFILRLTDKNGQRWLVGTLDNPLTFRAGAAVEPSAYTISFEGRSSSRAFGYLPVF